MTGKRIWLGETALLLWSSLALSSLSVRHPSIWAGRDLDVLPEDGPSRVFRFTIDA